MHTPNGKSPGTAGSSGSNGLLGSPSVSSTTTRLCFNCEEECPSSDMTGWSKVPCLCNYMPFHLSAKRTAPPACALCWLPCSSLLPAPQVALSCRPCKTNYNRNLERMAEANGQKIKLWWKDMGLGFAIGCRSLAVTTEQLIWTIVSSSPGFGPEGIWDKG